MRLLGMAGQSLLVVDNAYIPAILRAIRLTENKERLDGLTKLDYERMRFQMVDDKMALLIAEIRAIRGLKDGALPGADGSFDIDQYVTVKDLLDAQGVSGDNQLAAVEKLIEIITILNG